MSREEESELTGRTCSVVHIARLQALNATYVEGQGVGKVRAGHDASKIQHLSEVHSIRTYMKYIVPDW